MIKKTLSSKVSVKLTFEFFATAKISCYTFQVTITTVVLGGLILVESLTGFVFTELIYLDGTTCPVKPYLYHVFACVYTLYIHIIQLPQKLKLFEIKLHSYQQLIWTPFNRSVQFCILIWHYITTLTYTYSTVESK